MNEYLDELNRAHREVTDRTIPAGAGRSVVVRRRYDAPIDDVWDAITDADRLSRWFLPISGDLRVGGSYQLEGNARGEILQCERPRLVKITWIYGENVTERDVSEVEVRLTADGDATDLVLEHAAVFPPEFWDRYGPGAVGVGWDLGLLGLALYLRGSHTDIDGDWESSPEAQRFSMASSEAWGAALAAYGGSDEEVAAAVRNTSESYAPDLAVN